MPRIAAFLALAAGLLSADEPRKIRMNVAVNPYPTTEFMDYSSAFTVSMKPMPQGLLSLRIFGESELACEPCDEEIKNTKGLHSMTEYSLLAGYVRDEDHLGLSASAGPAYVFGQEKIYDAIGSESRDRFNVVGLALDARATYMFNRTIGLGIVGFGNVNSIRTIYGAMAALELRVW